MKEFQDMYEATDNLGQPRVHPGDVYRYLCLSKQILLSPLFSFWRLSSELQWQHIKGRRAGDMMVKQTFSLPLILGLHWAVCPVILVALSLHLDSSLFFFSWLLVTGNLSVSNVRWNGYLWHFFVYQKRNLCFFTNVWCTKKKSSASDNIHLIFTNGTK